MIDIDLIRRDPDRVRSALQKRMDVVDLDPILAADERRRALTVKVENLRSRRNQIASRLKDRKSLAADEATALQQEASSLRGEVAALEPQLKSAEEQFDALMQTLPNLPDDRVPAGGKESNRVVHTWGTAPMLATPIRDHVTLCERLGLVDYRRGTKLGGNGFWLYTARGAALEWALLNFFCQEHYRDGYTFLLPPHLLLEECGYAAGQFPKFRDDVFHLADEQGSQHRFLLPTSETAIVNVHRDEILEFDALPLKYFAFTPCYRREAGSHRTEERGTIRGHQFNKVEMFQFVAGEQADAALDELVQKAQRLVEALGLHYRTALLAAQDTSAAMAMTYDIEVWIPSMNAYKEVSSASLARDYQSRRANIRFRRPGSKKTELVHTLNASGLATSRLLPAIVEQNQQADGSVVVPVPLREWLGVDVLRPAG